MVQDETRPTVPGPGTDHRAVVSRRAVAFGALGIGGGAVLLHFLRDRDSVDHVVVVGSVREATHEVSVETAFDGEVETHGPRSVGFQDHWEVAEFTEPGELSVTFSVDGEVAWEDSHELPRLSGDRQSITLFELQPDGEVLTRVKVED